MSFDELLKDLQGQNKVEEDPNFVALDLLFTDAFMSKHTRSASFAAFLEKGNFQVKTYEDVRNIPDELFDRYIARETDYPNWESMLAAANKEYAGQEKK
ncbi:hypothetical protein [Cohnella lubricantis]|uniref:Uncharacterized protein n=1 Tax=Cohnella lubricantis TaxID=2163172 RepID=A0A841T8W3_9BACL|nr:hypothetical protein [Cohnella lubricantis]MBB6675868.1 hypothetical protein [Cohnella lubricantis]